MRKSIGLSLSGFADLSLALDTPQTARNGPEIEP
jgi:hypothetical protein